MKDCEGQGRRRDLPNEGTMKEDTGGRHNVGRFTEGRHNEGRFTEGRLTEGRFTERRLAERRHDEGTPKMCNVFVAVEPSGSQTKEAHLARSYLSGEGEPA